MGEHGPRCAGNGDHENDRVNDPADIACSNQPGSVVAYFVKNYLFTITFIRALPDTIVRFRAPRTDPVTVLIAVRRSVTTAERRVGDLQEMIPRGTLNFVPSGI